MRIPIRKPGKYANQERDPQVTAEKLDQLKRQLERLKKVSQPPAIAEVKRLAEIGDFSENAAYQMAKGRLRGINQRMLELQDQINRAVVIAPVGDMARIQLGHRVTVEINGKQKTFLILGSSETDPSAGVISHHSPIGAALMGHRVGDVVAFQLSNKKQVGCTIVSIR